MTAQIELYARRTAVYRLYDMNGALLYVGITCDLEMRWIDHRRRSWWPQVADKDIAWHEDRHGALREEAAAIEFERPIHNVAGSPTRPRRASRSHPPGQACLSGDRHRTPRRPVTFSDADWDELGEVVGERNRSEVVRRLVRAFLKKPGARMPKRSDYEGNCRDAGTE